MERFLIVLDLDETLIHATCREDFDQPSDFKVFEQDIYRRPYLDDFLDFCFANFFVGVWSSASSSYAKEIVKNIMDPTKLHFLWGHEHCKRRFDSELSVNHAVKPIRSLIKKGYSEEKIVAIDDSPKKWINSNDNLIPVEPFRGDTQDDELQQLITYLELLKASPDIRKTNKESWLNRNK